MKPFMQPRFNLAPRFIFSPLGLQIMNDISLIDDITHPGFCECQCINVI